MTSSLWAPFTAMRPFNRQPMLFDRAAGMHYTTTEGRDVLDAMAGLWCVNAGHGQPRIVEAIREAAGRLDFVSSFKMSHPAALTLADQLVAKAPANLDKVFFTNSGSEAVDTALKIARAYHQARGDSRRTKLIGRAKGYHGMGFGGLSVSGIGRQKRDFGPLLGDVAHLPLPYDAGSRFSLGQPEQGAHYADALLHLLEVHDPATVAAVIVEPVTGSGGVYAPPLGYLQKLREICDRHGLLLIFDEVITGFGRVGHGFAAEAFGVTPDLMTLAKGLTNGAVPMGGVLVSGAVYEAFMQGPEQAIELMHGYTYSAHPLACAAGLATLEVHEELGLNAHVRQIAPLWQNTALALREQALVLDVRAIGLLCAVELKPREGAPGARAAEVAQRCFEAGVLVRASGENIVLSPPLIINQEQVAQVFSTLGKALEATR
ncbi:aminotransferase class III-fold pyridoxal phosphate-dependent enzyme [Pseudomonas simiae]|jgi:beta-alanine--pyruvate transaminase|uniref:aminotransferase class III-fold pyridoxal phosphate-dependent enzyme n=1 Tax=Pseudomonas simiae TaxID=321846 RepID=UPI000D02674E|nr:aminotransferase class III-fold pyridoxal phosphate-dependent enzyme [Pseudomonas simiae]MBI6614441.1 aminotransferase class III-fold pyridoxal phosphate-dependent enzyme [Pseudomonas simiae]NVH61769.1 aminotransferase class III-fold pyridoxal phosphate-dependent enzyme [Pseudomonas simiae]PRW86731.1 aspartate aminotransferase family protein [Pseudomonas simiae]WLG36204.1 aminotransferase class III-fold pyridoxal phosphate-dependent enzyme [Pseudomonas simiae]